MRMHLLREGLRRLAGVSAATMAITGMLVGSAAAQPLPLVSASDAQRVFVSGVAERFDAVRVAVERLPPTAAATIAWWWWATPVAAMRRRSCWKD